MRKIVISLFVMAVFVAFVSHIFALTPEPRKGQKMGRFTGRVTSVNISDRTMVAESMKAGMTFEIGAARVKGDKTVNSVKEGDRVTVQYVMSQGKTTARTIKKNKPYG